MAGYGIFLYNLEIEVSTMERMIKIEKEIINILNIRFCRCSEFNLLFFLAGFIFFINTIASIAYFITTGYLIYL